MHAFIGKLFRTQAGIIFSVAAFDKNGDVMGNPKNMLLKMSNSLYESSISSSLCFFNAFSPLLLLQVQMHSIQASNCAVGC
jgi:hypothetical protein